MIMRCDYQPRLSADARRRDYLNLVPANHKLELEILLESVYKANPQQAGFIHFPFWTETQDGRPINWYIQYKYRERWRGFKRLLNLCDDIIAVNFSEGNAIVLSRIEAGLSKIDRTIDLRHPDALTYLGNHIFKLLS